MRSQYCPYCHKRVELQKPVDRPVSQLPKFITYCADYAEPYKQQEKEDLTYSSNCYDFHNHTVANIGLSDS